MDFGEILEEASVGILVLDREGNITSANSVLAYLLGFSKDISGESNIFDLDFVVNSELYDVFQNTLLTGEGLEVDQIYTSREGKELYVSVRTLPQTDEDGEVLGLIAIIEDVAEKAKLSLRIKKLADITDSSADAIVGFGLFRGIESWNKGAEDIFGYTKNEVIGKKFDELFSNKKVAENLWKEVVRHGLVRNFETYQRHKSGKLIPVNMTATVVKDGLGNIVGVSAVIKDITERKEAQKRLEKYARELEHSNRLKDLFTDIMRHDLLNQIYVIRSLAEMIAEDEKLKESDDSLQVIRRSARKLEEMIKAAASYARLESAEDIKWEEMDLNEIIKNAEDSLKPHFKEKHMKLEHLPEGKYVASTVPIVEEVFVNLLSNAVKHNPENTKVTVNIEDTGKNLRVTVADQGAGVPDEFKESIFSRFTRREKKGVKGSGLGLAIVKRIAELHGGATGVMDNPGGGSIFYFEIPKTKEVKTRER
jgi:PAS domain S-box-containing protein